MVDKAAQPAQSAEVAGPTAEGRPQDGVIPKTLKVPTALTIGDLASLMKADPIDVIKQLMRAGQMLTINDVVEHEMAAVIAQSFGFQVEAPSEEERGPGSLVVSSDEEDLSQLQPRPPVVTILGHVDHGKTTLLDSVRNSNLVSKEVGGITQHIGAYQVESKGKLITFLDTPGHEAFTSMRARGAQVTDIGVLVVAADDGIMPQTVEAIDHVKAAGVPIIVAINKVDRPDADPEVVKRQLSEHDLLVEEWGGEVVAVPVSALTGEGVPDLLENVLVVAEVAELKANPHREGRGVVVEARIDKKRGPVATVLVQTGTLKVGDGVVAGEVSGRVKAMLNDRGKRIMSAGPSDPVEILGMDGLPQAGDILTVAVNEKSARQIAEAREREREMSGARGVSLEEIYSQIETGEAKALNLIVKTDVQGSIDAVRGSLERLSTDDTRVNLIHAASASITENDVLLASASNAIIIGFNTTPEPGASTLAGQHGIDIRLYQIIYDLIDDVEKALKGLLTPAVKDVVEGVATVRAVFSIGRGTVAAGIYVNDGRIARGAEIHVLRNAQPIFTGPIASLKHFKDDVREVRAGLEGGLALEGFEEYREGDVLEAHRIEEAD